MKINKDTNILIVGLGLIGGSYARGFSKAGYRIKAIDTDQRAIDYALERGIICAGTSKLDRSMIEAADVVIFALYPHIFREWIEKNQWYLKSGAVITDVTGVKGGLVRYIQNILRDDCEYIAAHPMAGCEKLGIEHSDEKIFYGANYIVVSTEKNSEEAKALCRQIGQERGIRLGDPFLPRRRAVMKPQFGCVVEAIGCAPDTDICHMKSLLGVFRSRFEIRDFRGGRAPLGWRARVFPSPQKNYLGNTP